MGQHYRLGDIVWTTVSPKLYDVPQAERLYHAKTYPGSLASWLLLRLYDRSGRRRADATDPWAYPLQLLADRICHVTRDSVDADNDTFLVHLRTGDVMSHYTSGHEAFHSTTSVWFPTLTHFQQTRDVCRERNINRVLLIATLHSATPLPPAKARVVSEYVAAGKAWLESHDMIVDSVIRPSGHAQQADDDFIRYCRAKHLFLSSGGYAALIWCTRTALGMDEALCPLQRAPGAAYWWDCARNLAPDLKTSTSLTHTFVSQPEMPSGRANT
jgi:hypothetical protein